MIPVRSRAFTRRQALQQQFWLLWGTYTGVACGAYKFERWFASVEGTAALAADKHLYAKHMDVSAKDDVVHLGGFVATDTELQLAKKDAAAVDGVKNVNSEITLKPGASDSNTSGG